jgi:hypothetical protein
MSIAAMRQALEALDHEANKGNDNAYQCERDALRTAIEQAEKPVAWQGVHDHTDLYYRKPPQADVRPLYTTPPVAPVQEPVAHSVVAGVLFDFMGWLTSREKRLTLSSTDEAGPAVEAITEFAKMRGLHLEDAQVEHWQAILTTPPAAPRQWVGLTDEEVHEMFCRVEYETPNDWNTDPDDWCQQFARYLEANLKEKNA